MSQPQNVREVVILGSIAQTFLRYAHSSVEALSCQRLPLTVKQPVMLRASCLEEQKLGALKTT